MRAIALFLLTVLLTLWAWFVVEVAPQDSRRSRPVPVDTGLATDAPTAETLHNAGVEAEHGGRTGDATLYFQRAHQFRPLSSVYSVAYERSVARAQKRAWVRFLVPATALTILFLAFATLRSVVRRISDRRRVRKLQIRGDNWIRIRSDEETASFPLQFNRQLGRILKRHPLTVVWSSARHGKHMKSTPPVETQGRQATLRLDATRLERLRRYPGDWKGFFYLDGHEVGNATARVG